MKLIQCHVENFGKIHNWDYYFSDGINCIFKDNGWGKTTFAAFLQAMFYGLDIRKKKVSENDRKRYMPWQGGIYGGSLEFEEGGIRYRMERVFKEKAKDDTFVLYQVDTGMISTAYSSDIGQELFGMDREGFSASLYGIQNQLGSNMGDGRIAKLSEEESVQFSDQMDMMAYEKAIKQLENQIRYYQKTGNRGRLAQLSAERWNLQCQLQELCQQKDDTVLSPQEQEEFIQLQREFSKGEPNIQQLQYWSRCYYHWNEMEREEENLMQRQKTQWEEQQQMQLQENRMKKISGILYMGSGMLGLIFAIWIHKGIGLGLLCLALCGGIIGVVQNSLRKKGQLTQVQNQFQWKANGQEEEQLELQKLHKKKKQIEEQWNQWIATYGFEKEPLGSEAFLTYIQLLMEKRNRLQYLKQIQNRWNEQKEERNKSEQLKKEELLDSIAQKTAELNQGEAHLKILQWTMQYLKEAREQLVVGYKERINENLKEYMQKMEASQCNLALDTQFKVYVDERSGRKEQAYYSAGLQDRMYLSLRFAMIDALFPTTKPFLILDDPFVNLDEGGIQSGKSVLKQLAQNYQIIYMTCHQSRVIETE